MRDHSAISRLAKAVADLRASDEKKRDDAWNELYEIMTPSLVSLVWDERARADAVALTWAKFYLRIHAGLTLEPVQVYPYLRRTCLSVLKRDRSSLRGSEPLLDQPAGSNEVIEAVDANEVGASPFDDAIEAWESDAMRDGLLKRLAPPDIALYALLANGFSTSEIAKQLDVSPGSLHVRAHRLRARIRKLDEGKALLVNLRARREQAE